MPCSELRRSPPRGRHSTSWALGAALEWRGFEAPPEAVVFGLGGSAWYHWDLRGPVPILRGLHPDRLQRAFHALDVWAVRFNYLSPGAVSYLEKRWRLELQTLVHVDRRLLDGSDGPLAGGHGDFTVLVTGVRRGDVGVGGPILEVLGPADGGRPQEVDLIRFEKAWYRPAADVSAATFYMYPVKELRWSEGNALRRALHRLTLQMRQTIPTLGATGLRGLEAFTRHVEAGGFSALEPTALLALEDGGEAFHRDLLAEFLDEAARRVAMPALGEVAGLFSRSAALWRGLLQAFLRPPWDGSRLSGDLARVGRLEASAVERLDDLLQAGGLGRI